MSEIEVSVSARERRIPDMTSPDAVDDVFGVSVISGREEVGIGYGSKAECVEALEEHIREAEAALEKLRLLTPCAHDWVPEGERREPHNGGTAQPHRCSRCGAFVTLVVDKTTARQWYAEEYYGAPKAPDEWGASEVGRYWERAYGSRP